MRHLLFFMIFFLSMLNAEFINVDDKTNFYNILPDSKIYIDHTKILQLNDIILKDYEFKKNSKKLLGYGYSPDFTVWIKFSLINTTDKKLRKIIEYENSLSTHIRFIDTSNNYAKDEGLFQISKDRKTINPIFEIELLPNESRTFYIKASSRITTLIIKLNLWEHDSFYEKEIKHQLVLALFFGAMFILGVYNLFIYVYTKDVSYLFYVLYIFGIIMHQLIYVGLANLYLLDQNLAISFVKYASILVSFPAISLALFTQYFLDVKQYPKLNRLFNISIALVFTISILYCFMELPQTFRNLLPALLLVLLLSTTIYATIKKNHQAYFILLGWFMFISSGIFMYLSSVGLFNIYSYAKYFIEISLVSEAIIFSIALAYRIRQLQKEKDEASMQLILQQQNETKRLERQVQKKTVNLTQALNEKEILLKELNHRVKNNMQTMLSLLRFQIDDTKDKQVEEQLLTVQNRINAISHLHELLYLKGDISYINAKEYITILANNLEDSYDKDISINLEILTNIKTREAADCGLLINELVTNSFKYAFPENRGNVYIKLLTKGLNNILTIRDNGIGFNSEQSFSSLGLMLVKTLVEKKLNGQIDINSKNGVEVKIIWKL